MTAEPDSIPRPALDRLTKGSAARELAEAIGRPALAARVVELCGPNVGAVLAEAVDAAVARRTRAIEEKVAAELDQVHAQIVDRWSDDGVEPECVAPEPIVVVPTGTNTVEELFGLYPWDARSFL